jgi:hypothetical protein
VKWDSVKWVVGEIVVGEMYPNRFCILSLSQMRKTLEKQNNNNKIIHIKVYFFGEFQEFLEKNP